ncbi:SPOR domain-containing protein [Falsiroseomonas bella]|nr:SPOR domain-containing protein [Falsiroseomonas bella]
MDAMVPSYRVQREASGVPWRMLAIAGGLLAVLAVAAGGWWALRSFGQSGPVPVVEADPRPFKVKPEYRGGLRVPNQDELILDRPSNRAQLATPRNAVMMPEAEAPNIGGLRAAVAPPAPVVPPAPVAAPEPAAPAPAEAQATAPAAEPPPVRTGRVQVQLGALNSPEAARAEWDRLSRRAPELFEGRSPQILRLERGEGQAPLFRLRTGGLPDQDAATEFCQQIRARGGACVPIRG